MLDKLFEVIGEDNDLLSTKTCHAEFLCTNTCKANGLPDSGDISLSSGIICSLIFLEHDVGLSELLVVVNALEKDFGRKEKTLVKASFSALEDISLVGFSHEIFEFGQESFTSHSVCEDKFTVDDGLFFVSSGHKKIGDEFFVVVLLLGGVDNSLEVFSIFGLDESIDALTESSTAELSKT